MAGVDEKAAINYFSDEDDVSTFHWQVKLVFT